MKERRAARVALAAWWIAAVLLGAAWLYVALVGYAWARTMDDRVAFESAFTARWIAGLGGSLAVGAMALGFARRGLLNALGRRAWGRAWWVRCGAICLLVSAGVCAGMEWAIVVDESRFRSEVIARLSAGETSMYWRLRAWPSGDSAIGYDPETRRYRSTD